MDVLDRLAGPGQELLSRVDAVLAAAGAPADHPVWPLLGRVGALPGDVLAALSAMEPDRLLGAAAAVRVRSEAYAAECADLSAAVAATNWAGDAADAFGVRWTALGGHLGDSADPSATTLAGRLAATASYVDDVAAWMRSARRDLAHEIATALGSLEAVHVRGSAPSAAGSAPSAAAPSAAGAALAAATIAVAVLAVADRQAAAAEAVAERWAGRLADLPVRPAAGHVRPSGQATHIPL